MRKTQGFAVGRQAFTTLRGKPGKLGNCCAKGCNSDRTAPEAPKREGVAFISSESLSVRARARIPRAEILPIIDDAVTTLCGANGRRSARAGAG